MTSACNHIKVHIIHGVNQSMHVVNTPSPVARQVTQQGFGFADARERFSACRFNQQVDSFERLFVLPQPVVVVVPSGGCEPNRSAHTQALASSRCVALPDLCSAIDFAKCAALAGLASKCMVSMMLW